MFFVDLKIIFLLGAVDNLMHLLSLTYDRLKLCIRLSTAPQANSFDYTPSSHDITGYYLKLEMCLVNTVPPTTAGMRIVANNQS